MLGRRGAAGQQQTLCQYLMMDCPQVSITHFGHNATAEDMDEKNLSCYPL